jgi:phage terminase large subunit-like protein
MGLDLSSTTDLTGLTVMFPPQEGLDYWYSIFYTFIPQNNMKDRIKKDGVPYQQWCNEKYIKQKNEKCKNTIKNKENNAIV